MVSEKQIRELIKQGESTTVEFKSCTNKISASVYESICAFLNREGGHLLIGVDDDGIIQGINENSVTNMIRNFINILNNPQIFIPITFLSPEIIKIDGKTIIYVNVPESSQAHRYKGSYYDRVNDADNDITQSFYLVDNLHLRKRRESSENEVFPYLAMSDFDDDTFKKMRNQISIHNPQHPWLYMEDEEILHSSFWRKDPVTNKEGFILAAIVLFGKENSLLSCCPYHRTDAIYRSMSYERDLHPLSTDPDIRYDDRDMICVNLIQSYLRLMNFVARNMPDKFRLDEQSINRIDVRNLIFREIVANMLVHREFTHTFSSKFLIFSDRVITENWTKPVQYGDITLDNWESHTKNPLITKVFREMKWVEELGSGQKNIKKYAPLYYDDYQIEIQNKEKFVFSITYRNPQEFVLDTDKSPASHQQVTSKSPASHRQVASNLDINWDVVAEILELCKEPKSRSEILTMGIIKDRNTLMKKYIKPLIDEKLLAMTVPDKPNSRLQKYYTTDKGKSLD